MASSSPVFEEVMMVDNITKNNYMSFSLYALFQVHDIVGFIRLKLRDHVMASLVDLV